jgi:cytosine/adenosine deaminase-related metal-dependent hydrolase
MLLRHGLVDLGDGQFGPADILVADGRITSVARHLDAAVDEAVVDCSGLLVVPGMVNAHAHSNENWFRGLFDSLPLELWELGTYPVFEGPAQSKREVYVRTLLSGMELVRSGATCVADFLYELPGLSLASLEPVVHAYRDLGLRALIVLGIGDRPFRETIEMDVGALEPDLARRLEDETPPTWAELEVLIREAVRAYHRPEDGVALAAGPSGPQRCTDQMLEALPGLAGELDLRIHTHLLETRMQAVVGARLYGCTVPEHLREIGFLGERVSLAHGIWLTSSDIRLVADSGAAVVHNPLSNLKLGSGVCPVPAYLAAGVPLALGTDGSASADGVDMFLTLRMAALQHTLWGEDHERWPRAADAWQMATQGGAVALGDQHLGRIAEGSRADIALLDLGSRFFTPLNDPLYHLVFSGASEAVDSVMIGGRWVLRKGILTTVDEPAILAEARELAEGVVARHTTAFAEGARLHEAVRQGWLRALHHDVSASRFIGGAFDA